MKRDEQSDQNTCWECQRPLRERKVGYSLYGIKLGTFPARVCDHCHETYFSEDTSRKITRLAKQKGLWGLHATSTVGQAGNALDIRLPKRLAAFLKLRKGEEVTLYPESRHKLVISV